MTQRQRLLARMAGNIAAGLCLSDLLELADGSYAEELSACAALAADLARAILEEIEAVPDPESQVEESPVE